jgi:tetratricopeptide (TPR) repeat protein
MNIKARAHFLVVLTPSALERLKEPNDWLRREIETAMEEKRNIVPLMLESFDFGSPLVTQALTGKLAALKNYNGLRVYSEYFFEAMDKLRERYLNVQLSTEIHPLSDDVIVQNQTTESNIRPQIEQSTLTALEFFEQGSKFRNDKNYAEAIRCYTESINLDLNFSQAYLNRGIAFLELGNTENALEDYANAIAIQPDYHEAYCYRGIARYNKGDLNGAINDLTESTKLKPDYVDAYKERGILFARQGNLVQAIQDLNKAVQLNSQEKNAETNNHIVEDNIVDTRLPKAEKKHGPLKIFLSHVSQDKAIVREVYKRLIADGYDAWLDEEKLLPGQNWSVEIEKAIENTDIVIAFLSHQTIAKDGYIQKELRRILYTAETKPEGKIFIIPVRIEDCELPLRFRQLNLHYLDYFPSEQKDWAYRRLLESLQI